MQYIPTSLPSNQAYIASGYQKKMGIPVQEPHFSGFSPQNSIRNEESIKIHPRTSKIQPEGVHSSRNQRAEGTACETGAGRGNRPRPGRPGMEGKSSCLAETGRTPLEGCWMLELAAGFIATLLTPTPELESSQQTELGVGISSPLSFQKFSRATVTCNI